MKYVFDLLVLSVFNYIHIFAIYKHDFHIEFLQCQTDKSKRHTLFMCWMLFCQPCLINRDISVFLPRLSNISTSWREFSLKKRAIGDICFERLNAIIVRNILLMQAFWGGIWRLILYISFPIDMISGPKKRAKKWFLIRQWPDDLN